MYEKFGLYIAGEWRQTVESFEVFDPATEEALGTVPSASEQDIEAAITGAVSAASSWRATAPRERSALLRNAAGLVRARLDDYARIMTLESGKPLDQSKAEFAGAADYFDWYAEEARRIYGQVIDLGAGNARVSVRYEPVGLVAAFTAWNFPALLPVRKIAAALAAGCPVILKPASECPGSAMALVEALHEAGCPPGVVGLLAGSSALISGKLIDDPRVRKISFTGSTEVGKSILKRAAGTVKKVSMELGGHAPVIVCSDADPEFAGRMAAQVKFRNAGQVCISPSRFYVHGSLHERFSRSFADYARGLVLGPGMQDGAEMGPLASKRGLAHAERLVDDAVSGGADLLAGGGRPARFNKGWYFEPTVLDNVPDDAAVMREEPFAPVAPIAPFSDLDEVLARANDTPYGLAAYVFTQSLSTANRVSEELQAGMVGVNDLLLSTPEAPFGGIKESGIGREGGALGIYDYLEPKYVKTAL
ncbi:NAD-dependent succinate-semialdehyde dehydrogenase [uncultured Erythrobacter sp.]|uniref:NAD-dependent succinate-semialdehyde dehydrogenase n=1 Tax=uncultured Erythrobacter sp. TaxID=263913 RepID=UPI00262982F6|nr:NAD-dependent succinate-semialdehyde dehydrogenase [uncultured Erythrobacter sp.]